MNLFLKDVNASLVTFLVALPLCLGISMASDAPLLSGLLAGIVGGVIVGLLGGSQVAVSGPAAGLTIVVATAIQKLGSFELFCQSLFWAGFIQILLAVVGFDKLGRIIPLAITKGLLSAIGLLICYKELPYILGVETKRFYSSDVLEHINTSVIVISLVAAVTILSWDFFRKNKSWAKLFPSQLLAVVMSAVFASVVLPRFGFFLDSKDFVHLPLIENFWSSTFTIHEVSWAIISTSITIALIASVETLLCLEASLILDSDRRPLFRKKELVAQGLGNVICGFLGGLPITAVIVRTAANIDAGAKTKLSAIMHGLWLLVFVVFFSGYAEKIPLSALAVILIFIGFKLFSPSVFISVRKKGVIDLFSYFITILAILVSDILIGVVAGSVVRMILIKLIKSEGAN